MADRTVPAVSASDAGFAGMTELGIDIIKVDRIRASIEGARPRNARKDSAAGREPPTASPSSRRSQSNTRISVSMSCPLLRLP